VSIACRSGGEDPEQVQVVVDRQGLLGVRAEAVGLLGQRRLARHPERRGELPLHL
jgi:hypothetical protein